MTIKIHRILKDSLNEAESISAVGVPESSSMTISHFAFSSKQTEAILPYSIEIVNEYVPVISEIDFCVVVRTKVDFTAPGVNSETIEGIGNDIGEYKYTDNVPSRPLDLPPGFTELYRK